MERSPQDHTISLETTGKEGWQSAVQRIESALNVETEQQVQTLKGMYSVSDQDPRTARNQIHHDIIENQSQNYFLSRWQRRTYYTLRHD